MPSTPKVVECDGCHGSIWFDWGSKPGDPGRSQKTGKLVPLQVQFDEIDGVAEFKQERHNCPAFHPSNGQQQQQQQPIYRGPDAHLVQDKDAIPGSGPKPGDWETKIGLVNGQVFMRLDRIDENIRKIFVALGFAAASASDSNDNTEPSNTTE
jgi:hypothetical protein